MPFGNTLLCALASMIAPCWAWSATVLHPQDVVDQVLKKSFQVERITWDRQWAQTELELALGRFDFTLKGNLGYEYREAEALSAMNNPIDKTLTAGLSLIKHSQFGGEFETGYRHLAQASTLSPIVTNLRDPTQALDEVYLQWRQPLWANLFGISDRLDLGVAKRVASQAELKKQESTEELVLQSLRAYWDAYVAQTQMADALSARQIYKRLIATVERRGRFGLDRGGEYAQVMADYTEADNAVKSASYTYLAKLNALELLLQTEFAEDLQFQPGELVPAVPKNPPAAKENLRAVQIERMERDSAEEKSRSTRLRQRPSVDLIARVSSTGVDSRADAAYSEMISGNRPTYFVGVEFLTQLDSSTRRAIEARDRIAFHRTDTSWREAGLKIDQDLKLFERRAEETFAVATGAIEMQKYRERTVKEQEGEYKTGRLPLRDLLQTYRMYLEAQAKKVRAIGDYHMALNELAALRDELVR